MFFTARAEYGVRLMIVLARDAAERPMSLTVASETERLPLSYLEQVVPRLKEAGLVRSTRGAHGGYRLTRPAAEITMDEVVQALEGPLTPMDCFDDEGVRRVLCSHEPGEAHTCATKLLWTRVQGGMLRALQHTTLDELAAFPARRADPAPPAERGQALSDPLEINA